MKKASENLESRDKQKEQDVQEKVKIAKSTPEHEAIVRASSRVPLSVYLHVPTWQDISHSVLQVLDNSIYVLTYLCCLQLPYKKFEELTSPFDVKLPSIASISAPTTPTIPPAVPAAYTRQCPYIHHIMSYRADYITKLPTQAVQRRSHEP